MQVHDKVASVQRHLQKLGIDGWLLYDFQRRNPLALNFLEISEEQFLSRRFFYWIPATGAPVRIVHEIEPHALDHLPGEKRIYLRWQSLEKNLRELLSTSRVVAMEYSPHCAVPYVSLIDAGTIDLVRECGVKVVSSDPFLQCYNCVLSDEQVGSLEGAAVVVRMALDTAWDSIQKALLSGRVITDYDVQQIILKVFKDNDCVCKSPPHCAVNADSADPHFSPNRNKPVSIQLGDFVLIDLWCKKKTPHAIYVDVTQVGVMSKEPVPKVQEIFTIVRNAQKKATDFIEKSFNEGKTIKGYEVDEVCRKVIIEAGYGEFFTHRTGHNIYTDLHGPGTHLDSLETYDDRPLLKGTCCSVEPGIYFPGEFGVRLEYDVYIDRSGKIHIFGGVQEELITLN